MSFSFSDIIYGLGLISSLGILTSFLLQKPESLSIHLYTFLLPSVFCVFGTIIYIIEEPEPKNIQKRFVLSLFSSLITIAISSVFVELKRKFFPPEK